MTYKPTLQFSLVLFSLSIASGLCDADGLIYQLPEVGVWARYEEQTKAHGTLTSKVLAPKNVEQEFTRKLIIKSLDRIERHEQTCRWIELISEPEVGDAARQPERILKFLVAEEHLQRGQDPLSHTITTFFSPSSIDRTSGHIRSNIHVGFNRVQYELDRIRPVFPKPLNDVQALGHETLDLNGRTWKNCEVLAGTTRYDGPLSADGRMVFDSTCRIALHPDAPFGIVSLEIENDGIEYSKTVTANFNSTHKITLVEFGRGAKTSLQPMTTIETPRGADSAKHPVALPEGQLKTQPNDSFPPILKLDRIMRAKDGNALRQFVLLGSPAWQKSLDRQVQTIETKQHSILGIAHMHIDGTFARITCRVAIDGEPIEHLATFAFVQRKDKWRMLMFFADDHLHDLKEVLTDKEWIAVVGDGADGLPKKPAETQ